MVLLAMAWGFLLSLTAAVGVFTVCVWISHLWDSRARAAAEVERWDLRWEGRQLPRWAALRSPGGDAGDREGLSPDHEGEARGEGEDVDGVEPRREP